LSSDEPGVTSGHREKGDALKSLGEQLNDPCLKSSTRILILISLAINGKLGFSDLIQLTATGKGSLSNHLEKLEAAGYVKTRKVMVWGGHRVMIEVTQKGLGVYGTYMRAMIMLSDTKAASGKETLP
jgi:DNA-binding MarR family transcriptional regulator